VSLNVPKRPTQAPQRIGPDLPEVVLTMDEAGRVDAGPSRHDADVLTVERAFIHALDGGPMRQTELLTAVAGRRDTKVEALRRAVESGIVIRSGAGGKADPYHLSLPPAADSGSQVPEYMQEPESANSKMTGNPNVFASHSGSQSRVILGTRIGSRGPESGAHEAFDL
jgi:hypothetical protein